MTKCKICVVGPCNVGKTLICKLVAEQKLAAAPEYSPTENSGVRCSLAMIVGLKYTTLDPRLVVLHRIMI